MTNQTIKEQASPEKRAQKVEEYRARFKPVFDRLGLDPKKVFMPKIPFTKDRVLIIQLFKSELMNTAGYYTIAIGRDYEVENNDFKLYHLKYNPNWATEYVQIETDRYAIPFSMWDEVNTNLIMISANLNGSAAVADGAEVDEHASKMTIRDYAAIAWKKPVSNKGWLNALILQNQ